MMEFCSCLQCEKNMESRIVQLEPNENNSNLSSIISLSSKTTGAKMIGYSTTRCLGTIFSIRPTRSFKNLCFLTAILTFCIGIGIGVLIPLYLIPKGESLSQFGRAVSSTDKLIYDSSNYVKLAPNVHQQRTPMLRRVKVPGSVMNQASTTTTTSTTAPTPVFLSHESTNTDEDISSRFPEFAQIQALVEQRNSNSNSGDGFRTKVSSSDSTSNSYNGPILLRPTPNVKFISSDSRILSLHPIQQQQQAIPLARQQQRNSSSLVKPLVNDNKVNVDSSSDLVEGIYWSSKVENELPKGFTDENVTAWRKLVEHSTVEKIEEGCGRMQNRLLTLENEVHACCRYRQNSDQIQGEIFSFYLSRLLGLENLAPSTLALIELKDTKWMKVRQALNGAQWTEEKPVVFTQFIQNLSPAYIPLPLRDSKRSLHPIDIILSSNAIDSSLDVKELAQWSDLIVFDYLTANLDRMVNNLYNLQWNPSMMEAPAHNLVKDTTTGLLVFLDNESGLLHGYRLLDKYEQYHRVMLDSLCVFRKSTVNAIKRLHRDKNVGQLLKEMFHSSEPTLVDYLPMMPDKSIKILNSRISRVYDQISKCESLYPL